MIQNTICGVVPLHTFRTRYLPHRFLGGFTICTLTRLPSSRELQHSIGPVAISIGISFIPLSGAAAYLESIVGKESPNKTLMPLLTPSSFRYTFSF